MADQPAVRISPNNKCNGCKQYVDERCAQRSVPRYCGARYVPIVPESR